jgi:succinoglycan biosynthesis protein ExoM
VRKAESMRVAVCTITYRRPEGLKRLIDGLDHLTFSKNEPSSLEIVVVDNDPAGLACRFCEGVRSDLNWPLRCFTEPRRGISYARNRAVTCAVDYADYVAFIDDDEVPEPAWLDELLYAQRLYDADVVAGRVLPHFNEPVSPWAEKGNFFENDQYPTGYLLEVAHTNNVLVRSEVYKNMWPIFDERFALSGGEDTHFFMRAHHGGYKIVWADDAVVYEWIPKTRATIKWLIRRSYNDGNNYSLCLFDLDSSWAVRTERVARASGRIVTGLLLLPVSVALGRRTFVKALQYIALGLGGLAGATGASDETYRGTGSVQDTK